MNAKRYSLLVFDWDGTLMDSAAKIVSCLRAATLAAGLDECEARAYRHIIGLGIHEAIDYLFPAGIEPVQRSRFIEVYRDQFVFANTTPASLFEGVRAMLEQLRAEGYRMAIATGKSRAGLDRVLAEVGLVDYFPVSRCADETCSKPDPMMLREILTDFDLDAGRALMVGDTEFDINMARCIGMDAVAVAHGAHTREQLRRAGPLAILEDIVHLLSWLASRPAMVS